MPVLQLSRRLLCFLALTLGALAFAATAGAGTIFFKASIHNSTTNVDDTSIRWMDDSDSSHTIHLLIRDWEDTPGAIGVYSPAILPVGTSTYSGTLIFTGETYASNGCGLFCEGLYKWVANTGGPVHGGTVTRLSPTPTNSTGSSFETDGEPTTDGHVVYEHAYGSSNPVFYTTDAFIRTLAPNTFGTAYGTECGYGDYDKHPSPSPVNAGLVAYGGCDQADPFSPEALVAGPNNTNKSIAAYDDQPIEDLSWNPAGTKLIDVETGGDPGLWVYGPQDVIANPSKPINYALANPGGYQFGSPRFIGTSRIIFDAYGTVTNLFTIPASCATASSPCQFPADATELTFGDPGTSFYKEPTWSPLTPAQLGLTPAPPPPVPNTTIVTHPPSSTTSQSASFTFTSTPAGATFTCSLDGSSYTSCVSGKSYSSLTRTTHTFRVRATNVSGTDATPAAWTWTITASTPPPTISGFTPTSAKTRTLVTINGTNLGSATAVKLGPTLANSLPMSISTKAATQIKAWLWDYNTYYPTGKIYVTTPGGTATSAATFTITFGISSVTPQSGPTGTLVTVRGVGFNSSSTLKINGTSAAVLAGRTATQLQVHVPSTATTGKITVTNTT
ncbi:MAG: hypothetical protein QOH23_2100, partial [Gaiellaceae bacterium]|nr:hypothetical protein [Gaiellaceae bacterium]